MSLDKKLSELQETLAPSEAFELYVTFQGESFRAKLANLPLLAEAEDAAARAEAAAAQSELLFDQFGDTYLGALAEDPTVDNDGDPLTTGDVYYNTTDNVLKFYSGTEWVAPEEIATTAAANALASEQAAATSETNAATSETNAATSEAAALASEQAAALSEAEVEADRAEVAANTAQVATDAAQVALDKAAAEAARDEAVTAASEAHDQNTDTALRRESNGAEITADFIADALIDGLGAPPEAGEYQALVDMFGVSDEGALIPSINAAVAEGTIWQDAAMTILATSVDDPVGAIEDLSGNGNHFLQSTATARPLLKQDEKGNWYLWGDGVDDELIAADAITVGTGFYMACSGRFDGSGGSASRGLFSTSAAANSINSMGIYLRGDSARQARAGLRVGAGTFMQAQENSNAFAKKMPFFMEGFSQQGHLYFTSYRSIAEIDCVEASETTGVDIGIFKGLLEFGFYGGIAIKRETTAAEKDACAEYIKSQSGVV